MPRRLPPIPGSLKGGNCYKARPDPEPQVYLNQDPLIKDKVKGKVKLFYNDPPFATKADFQSKDGATSYSDKIESAECLENMRDAEEFVQGKSA